MTFLRSQCHYRKYSAQKEYVPRNCGYVPIVDDTAHLVAKILEKQDVVLRAKLGQHRAQSILTSIRQTVLPDLSSTFAG